MLIAVFLLLFAVSCSVTRQIPADYPVLSKELANGSSKLVSVTYPSSEPGLSERRMYVYLPEAYDANLDRYPVLYMLHGARGDETSWITQGYILPKIDSLRSCGAVEQMLVVFPNMNSYDSDADFAKSRHKGALESFFEVDGVVETFFVNDAVSAVDSLFRTIPEKDSRAIAGLSLGGMQALYISASSPEIFGYVGILSAPLHSAIRKGQYSGFYKGLDAKIDAQFANPPQLYKIYVGKKDIYRKTMSKFSNELQTKGYNCEMLLDEGGHQWPQWTSFACDFMKRVFDK